MTKPEIIRFKPEFEKELLRLGVKTIFLKNRFSYCDIYGLDVYEINGEDNFSDFIQASFEWIKTPEGRPFWESIANRIKPIK